MAISHNQFIVVFLVGAFAATLLSMIVVPRLDSIEAVESEGIDVVSTLTPRQAFEKGVVSVLVEGKIEPNIISAKRGEVVLIPVVIEHLGKVGTSKEITITNFHNQFRNFAPSASEGMDDLEFTNYVYENDLIKGEIVMDEYVSVLPSSLTTLPNTSAPLMMTVKIPEDLPSEWTGASITIGLGYDVLPESSDIMSLGPSVTLQVVE